VGRVDFKKTNGNRPRRTPRRFLQLESGRDEIDVEEESSLQTSKYNEKKREATDIVKRGKKSEKEWTGQV